MNQGKRLLLFSLLSFPFLPPSLPPSLPPCSRVVAVAGDLFSVYRQTLELLQVQWHPHRPGALCLLTSDDTLRVFSLADPNVPLLTFPLSAPTPLHGCALDDSVVAFSLLSTAIFILRDTGDVHLSSLSPDAPCSPPLVMHPTAEDNYGSDASRILVLPTSPSTLIIANSSGTLHHCVYIHEEMQVYILASFPDPMVAWE